MSRRNLLRTPQGAWYHNYSGYPARTYRLNNTLDGFPTQPSPRPTDDQWKERELYPIAARINHDKKEAAEAAGGAPTVRQLQEAEMTHYERSGGLDGRPPLVDRRDIQAELERRRQDEAYITPRGNEYLGVPRNAGAAGRDHDNGIPGYNPYVDGPNRRSEWELEWEPPQNFSPRKTTYDPSLQQLQAPPPPASPPAKKIPPWEREREQQMQVQRPADPPKLDLGQGQGQQNEGRGYYGQMYSEAPGFDPRMARVEVPRPIVHHASAGAFLFVRFPLARGENVHVTAQACIRAKTSDLGGRFVGISKRVYDYGYPPHQDEGCAVFQFPSVKHAEKFVQYDPRIRQQDFPPPQGYAEIFAISLLVDPNTLQNYDTFLLSEITLNDGLTKANMENYIEQYVEPFTKLLEEPQFEALPFAAFSENPDARVSLRHHCFGRKTIVSLHMFHRPENLEDAMKDKRYSTLRAIHNAIATEKCSIFTIDRQACP